MDDKRTYPHATAGCCRPGFRIGRYTLRDGYEGNHKVHIEKGTGEGGDFDATELEALIAKYYDENF